MHLSNLHAHQKLYFQPYGGVCILYQQMVFVFCYNISGDVFISNLSVEVKSLLCSSRTSQGMGMC